MRPPGTSAFCVCSARDTSLTVRFCACSRSASSQTLIWRWRPPSTSTCPTPSALSSWRRSTLSAYSVMSRSGLFAVSATVSTGAASGSRFSIVGCVIVRGSSGRMRLTRSRTSCVATSAFFSSVKRDDDLRDALGRGRRQRVDAADRVDGFLDLVGDLALDLLRRGAGQAGRHENGRKVDVRELVDPELREAEDADRRSATRIRTDAKTGRRTQSAASHCMIGPTSSRRCGRRRRAGRRCWWRRPRPPSRPLVTSIRSPTVWPVVTIALLGAIARDDVDARGAGHDADGGGGHEDGRRLRRLLDARGGEESRLQRPVSLGTTASTMRARVVGLQRRRDVADLARERFARDRHPPRATRRGRPTTSAMNCSGTVSSTRSGLVRITEATFVPRVT